MISKAPGGPVEASNSKLSKTSEVGLAEFLLRGFRIFTGKEAGDEFAASRLLRHSLQIGFRPLIRVSCNDKSRIHSYVPAMAVNKS